jgi:hypothetical protein
MPTNSPSSRAAKVSALFADAREEGDLSASSLAALSIDADMADRIAAGLGATPDDIPATEVVLVTMMPDDSGSIRFAGNTQAVREGHNLVLDSLGASKTPADILVHTRYLNGQVLFPYLPLRDAVRMDRSNYDPSLGTPLYDETVVLLGTVLAKTRELEGAGIPVRTITLLITDGADEGSSRHGARSVRHLVDDLLRRECHIVAALGIDDGSTDFRQVFGEMGIPPEWILTPGSTASEIRKAFRVFSQSAVRMSASAAPSAVGGFVN